MQISLKDSEKELFELTQRIIKKMQVYSKDHEKKHEFTEVL